MNVWASLGFMFLGIAIASLFNAQSWAMYMKGKREMMERKNSNERFEYRNHRASDR